VSHYSVQPEAMCCKGLTGKPVIIT